MKLIALALFGLVLANATAEVWWLPHTKMCVVLPQNGTAYVVPDEECEERL